MQCVSTIYLMYTVDILNTLQHHCNMQHRMRHAMCTDDMYMYTVDIVNTLNTLQRTAIHFSMQHLMGHATSINAHVCA